MSKPHQRQRTLITGACGGMGRACAISFGATNDLVLTDIDEKPLAAFAKSLMSDGYTVVAAVASDLAVNGLADEVLEAANCEAGLAAVVHTAGISFTLADWQTIMKVNLIGTEKLLRQIEPLLQRETATILIASAAGHLTPASAADAILADPLAEDFMLRIAPILKTIAASSDPARLSYAAYGLTKRAIIAMCEARVGIWSAHGARIVSISPGITFTPMGERDVKANPDVAAAIKTVPAGRWGTAMEIASAARFLASSDATFITGCDMRIDGGVVAAFRNASQEAVTS